MMGSVIRDICGPLARFLAGAVVLGALSGGGCQSLIVPLEPELAAPPKELVRAEAWDELKRLTGLLEGIDRSRAPGVAALAADLRTAMTEVETPMGIDLDQIDAERLIEKNPHFWQASLEIAADDSLPGVIEVMTLAAAGRLEEASDKIGFLRAGPLMPEELDRRLLVPGHLIAQWQGGPPAASVWTVIGQPAQERWAPLKRLQQQHPDSALVAWEILRMRSDLAEIAMIREPTDEGMLARILELEPQAFELIRATRPLWAKIIETRGEAGDAARRIARRLTGDQGAVVVLTADDLAGLVADFERIGEPGWALRAARMQDGLHASEASANRAAWELLLPRLVGEDNAAAVLAATEPERNTGQVALFSAVAPPAGSAKRPMDPLIAGRYERIRREAAALIDGMEAPALRQRGAYRQRLQAERTLGDHAMAEADLNEYAVLETNPGHADLERLQSAIIRGDDAAVQAARVNLPRRLRTANTQLVLGLKPAMLGDWAEAENVFEKAYKATTAPPILRSYSALYVHAAAVLTGGERRKLMSEAAALVEEDDWVARLLRAANGEISREVLLAMTEEESDYEAVGRLCEAYFALAFAPGQTEAGRRTDLEACVATGVVGYMEYDLALLWLRRVDPVRWR